MTDFQFSDLEKEHPEFKIHKHMVDYLLQRVWDGNEIVSQGPSAFEGLMVIHVPNQESDGTDRYFQKVMGILPGAYDLFLYWPHRNCLAYDAKDKKGKLSAPQIKFRDRWEMLGFPSSWGSSTEHLRDTLIAHGAKCRIHAIKPLDLATDAEKKQRIFDMYKRPT